MKTFEDAMRMFIGDGQPIGNVEETVRRYDPTASEILDHNLTNLYCEVLSAAPHCCVKHAMISAFTNGVIIGIEMERSDAPLGQSEAPKRKRAPRKPKGECS